MLARARLGDDARLPHALREKRLAERVVDLVCARVREVLALEPDRGTARVRGEPRRGRQLRRSPDELAQQLVELEQERRVGARGGVGRVELLKRGEQRLGHIAPAERAEAAALVGNARDLRWIRPYGHGRHGASVRCAGSRRKTAIAGPESA